MADSDSTASPQIDISETLRIGEEVAREIGFLFPRIKKYSRSRTRVMPDGREILRGAAYERRRREVLRRDDYRCASCGSDYNVEVHHKQKRSILRDDRSHNLITLCANCHAQEHGGVL
ncbi:MAG: HNH endonuclease signature motif containing protein [Acidobacteriota bacterium]